MSEALCTWADCLDVGTKPQLDKFDQVWATLCEKHDRELDDAISKLDAKRLLSSWVKAQGGATRAAARHVDDIAKTAEALMLSGRRQPK